MPLSRTRLFLEDRELRRTPVAPVIHGATGDAAGTGAQAPCCAPAMPISTFCPQDPLPAADPKRSNGPQFHHAPAAHTQKLRGAIPQHSAAHPTTPHPRARPDGRCSPLSRPISPQPPGGRGRRNYTVHGPSPGAGPSGSLLRLRECCKHPFLPRDALWCRGSPGGEAAAAGRREESVCR